MDQSDDWLRHLTAPRRNHFFTGKMMGAAQFEREQRYDMGQRRLLNRLTVGSGILCGLEIGIVDNKRIRVAQGVAVDPLGREIVVARGVSDFDPFKANGGCGCGDGEAPTEPGDYIVCLSYRECAADQASVTYSEDCPDQPDCEPDSTVESYALCLRSANDPTLKDATPFACDTWTKPDGEKAPDVAELRHRLDKLFGTACAPSADRFPFGDCVPLGRVSVDKDGESWILKDPPPEARDPRVHIVTQAQLLDLVLCLARCCADHTTTTPPDTTPTDTASLLVTDLVVGGPAALGGAGTSSNIVELVVPLARLPGAPPRYVLPVGRGAVLAVAFNHSLDMTTVVLADPAAAGSPRSLALTRHGDTPGDPDLSIPLSILAMHLEGTTLLLIPSGASDDEAPVFEPEHVSPIGGGGGGAGRLAPGKYTVLLSGTSNAPKTPIRSDVTSTHGLLVLDGARTGTGSDFVYDFELVDTLERLTFTINGTDPPVPFSALGAALTLVIHFNRQLDSASVANSVELAAVGAQIGPGPSLSLVGDRDIEVVFTVQTPTDPDATDNAILVTVPKGTLRSADGITLDHDITFSPIYISPRNQP